MFWAHLELFFFGVQGFSSWLQRVDLSNWPYLQGTRPVENSCRWDATQPVFNFHFEKKNGWVCQDIVSLNLRMWWLFQSKKSQWIYPTLCKNFCFSTSTNPGYQQFEDHLQIWSPGMHVSNFPGRPDSRLWAYPTSENFMVRRTDKNVGSYDKMASVESERCSCLISRCIWCVHWLYIYICVSSLCCIYMLYGDMRWVFAGLYRRCTFTCPCWFIDSMMIA